MDNELYETVTLQCAVTGQRMQDPLRLPKSTLEAAGLHVITDGYGDDSGVDKTMAMCSRSSLPVHLTSSSSSSYSGPVPADVRMSRLLLCNPTGDSCVIWSNPISQLKQAAGQGLGLGLGEEELQYSFPTHINLSRRACPDGIMTVFSPEGLRRPYSLTVDKKGRVVVYTGSVMCGTGSSVFSPIDGTIELSDADQRIIAAQLKSQGESLVSSQFEDLRTPTEAIVICLDVSMSMGSRVDFRDDVAADAAHDVDLDDDDHWYRPP